MTDLLTLSGVHTHIGRYHILHGVDFAVAEGQTTMLLGRNGAGKTTTLRTIMGLWPASAGQISLAGQRIEQSATPDIATVRTICAADAPSASLTPNSRVRSAPNSSRNTTATASADDRHPDQAP